ncbi:MAG: DUF4395 domain-containing protein [Nocardioidaceae bacterium]
MSGTRTSPVTHGAGDVVDPRATRITAAVTTVVLAVVLATSNVWLLAVQAVLFGIAAALGVRRSPYGWAFVHLVRPRLGPPRDVEDATPPRFAQSVGFAFAAVGLLGYGAGATIVGEAATAAALAAAFLNAAFGLCLGCEAYLVLRRLRSPARGIAAIQTNADTSHKSSNKSSHQPSHEEKS